MTRRTIEVEQELHRHAPGHFSLIVTVTDDQIVTSREFTYFKTNRTYPAFKGLIATLRNYKDVDVLFKTEDDYLKTEINVIRESKGTLAKMLVELLDEKNITITAV